MFIFTEMSTSYEDCTNNKRKKYYILEEMKKITFEVIFPLPITYKRVSLESPKSFPGWEIDLYPWQAMQVPCHKERTLIERGKAVGRTIVNRVLWRN